MSLPGPSPFMGNSVRSPSWESHNQLVSSNAKRMSNQRRTTSNDGETSDVRHGRAQIRPISRTIYDWLRICSQGDPYCLLWRKIRLQHTHSAVIAGVKPNITKPLEQSRRSWLEVQPRDTSIALDQHGCYILQAVTLDFEKSHIDDIIHW
jgi:hypothetical protein